MANGFFYQLILSDQHQKGRKNISVIKNLITKYYFLYFDNILYSFNNKPNNHPNTQQALNDQLNCCVKEAHISFWSSFDVLFQRGNIILVCLVWSAVPWQSLGVCIKSNLNSHAAAGEGGQVEEIDAEMNKTWAKERKVTDQLKPLKREMRNINRTLKSSTNVNLIFKLEKCIFSLTLFCSLCLFWYCSSSALTLHRIFSTLEFEISEFLGWIKSPRWKSCL